MTGIDIGTINIDTIPDTEIFHTPPSQDTLYHTIPNTKIFHTPIPRYSIPHHIKIIHTIPYQDTLYHITPKYFIPYHTKVLHLDSRVATKNTTLVNNKDPTNSHSIY
ncbi:hypothetical protein CEXT_322111 [Caerostris extrusa]|uniref:Uncharacterized protein n=1 Tax=Caerostris extrusa TaxID=172846 RepID=A0AAV4SWP8_CAEEX|nr:hypothetical protein CEXT_322111 [Caerostris extrusa]